MAGDRTTLRATAAVERRPRVAATVHRSAVPAGTQSPARALRQRLGNQATQALVARSIAAPAKGGTTHAPAPVSTSTAAGPLLRQTATTAPPPQPATASPPAQQPRIAEQLKTEARADALAIKQILQENTWLGPRNQATIMTIAEKWANVPSETGLQLTPFDHFIMALRGATFEIGTLVKQWTSAFDQIFERMSGDRLAKFKGWMQAHARTFKSEQPIKQVRLEVSKEDVLDAAQLSIELAAMFASGGTSFLFQIGVWLGSKLPGLYQKAKAVMDFVNAIRSIKVEDVKRLVSPKGMGDLVVNALFGELQGLPVLAPAGDEKEEEHEPASGREEKGLVKVFHVLVRVFKALKSVYGRVAETVNKSLAAIKITNKSWFPPFSMIYAAVVKAVQVISDPASVLNAAVQEMRKSIGGFLGGIKTRIEERAAAIKTQLQIIGKPAQIMRTLADKAVEMVLTFIITNPPSALIKIAFKAVEAGAKTLILELVREHIPFADKLITKIAESGTVKSLLQPLEPPINTATDVIDQVTAQASGIIDDATGSAQALLNSGAQMVGKLAGVDINQRAAPTPAAQAGAEEFQPQAGAAPAATTGDFLGTLRHGVHTRLLAIGERNLLQKGKDLGKAAIKKGVSAAKGAAGKVVDWWKQKKPFQTKGGEKHEISFVGDEKHALPMVASGKATLVVDKLDEFMKRAKAKGASEAEKKAASLIETTRKAAVKDPNGEDLVTSMQQLFNTYHEGVKKPTIERQTGTLGGDIVGLSMTADWLGPELRSEGSPPGAGEQENLMGLLVTKPATPSESKFVKGHLLNENLGGPGKAANLFPITANANSRHLHSTEARVKSWMEKKKPKRWAWYQVKVLNVSSKLDPGEANRPANYVNCILACHAILKDAAGTPYEKFETIVPSTHKAKEQAVRINSPADDIDK